MRRNGPCTEKGQVWVWVCVGVAWEWGGSEGEEEGQHSHQVWYVHKALGAFSRSFGGRRDKDEYRETYAGRFQGATF